MPTAAFGPQRLNQTRVVQSRLDAALVSPPRRPVRYSHGSSYCCHVLPAARTSPALAEPLQAPRQHVITQAGFGFGSKSKKGSTASSKECPCGSGKNYSECCQVFHKSAAAHPNTPERLIQARYSAFVKKVPKYLRTTSHPDNPALQGSKTTIDDGAGGQQEKQCTYEEDLAMTFLAVDFQGLEILGSRMAADGSSCDVDVKARFKRLIDDKGQRVSKPEEQTWMERATLLKDDEGHWLVRNVQQLEAADSTGGAA